jgi:hypothetical protein
MSAKLLRLTIESTQLIGSAYRVMLVLAWYADSSNECSISISDLASAAHLTKQSVIRALHSLTASDVEVEGRSILTKARQGRGTGIPATYLIDVDLMRDLNRRRQDRLATEAQGLRPGAILMPAPDPTNDCETGNLAALVERGDVRTLRGQTNQKMTGNSGFSGSEGALPMSKREVTRRMRADAKAEALDIIEMMNGDKPIPWMIEQSSEILLEDAVPTRAGDLVSAGEVGEATRESPQICNCLADDCGRQPLFPRKDGLKSKRGTQTASVASNLTGVRWPRR